MPGNPFQILGLEPTFHLNGGVLQRAYLKRIAALHPDHAGGTEVPGDAVDGEEADSAMLNRARRELEDPERRAGALLSALGGPAKEADKSLPDGFLMEIMETREAVEAASTAQERARWRSWAAERRGAYTATVAKMFDEAMQASGVQRATTLAAIRRELNAWRYIERLIEQLDPDYDPARADFRE